MRFLRILKRKQKQSNIMIIQGNQVKPFFYTAVCPYCNKLNSYDMTKNKLIVCEHFQYNFGMFWEFRRGRKK